MIYLVIERSYQAERPDRITKVTLFDNPYEAVGYADDTRMRWDAEIDNNLLWEHTLFDEIVRPHLGKIGEGEARGGYAKALEERTSTSRGLMPVDNKHGNVLDVVLIDGEKSKVFWTTADEVP